MAIEKAKKHGVGLVAVRNSNHYGIAAYYGLMAINHDMIGISMTNTAPLVVPTFGRQMMIGTNPICVCAPANRERPFCLDMATSVVPRGKLEVYQRQEREIPLGWAVGKDGRSTTNAPEVLRNMLARAGGGILPLGGEGELYSGHKGYGLSVLVDIFCAALAGAAFTANTYPKTKDGRPLPSLIGHFFGAIRIDIFRPVEEFKDAMDRMIRQLKESPKAVGQSRIYIHGEKEFEMAEKQRREGITLPGRVIQSLEKIGAELGVKCPWQE
jgi:LDH2 family malate/lactate/ureidoglycolate dehydrogenase